MQESSAQKGIAHVLLIVGIVVVGLAAAFFIFDDFDEGGGPFGNYKSPPSDPEARLAWLSENVDNNNHEDFIRLDYEVPSWDELNKMNEALSGQQNYPDYIKATQTYGTLPNLIEVLYFGDVLKDMGVNTHFVHANYWFRDGEFELWYLGYDRPRNMSQDESKRALIHNILLAKQQGLAVVLFPDHAQLEDGGMSELGISDDLEEHLEIIALDLAQIAEEYNVEYFVPISQIETVLDTNGYPVSETQDRTNAFYAKIVPKVRKIYSGKVLYKMGGFSNWSNFDEISLEGADIFGFTTCSRSPNTETISREVKSSTQQASKMSEQYGIPWIGIEFFISNESDQIDTYGKVVSDVPIEKSYEVGLAAFEEYGGSASGFTVHSLLGGGKVYDTPAVPLIKDFFSSK